MGLFNKQKRSADDGAAARQSQVDVLCLNSSGKGYDDVYSSSLALKISTAYRCIDILSKGVASIPLRLLVDKGGWYAEASHRLNYMLKVRPNHRMSAYDMMRGIIVQCLTTGNAYIYPRVDPIDGMAYALELLAPGTVAYDEVSDRYSIADPYCKIYGVFESSEIMHIRNMGINGGGCLGESTISYASRVLAISANADLEQVRSFKSGGLLKGFVTGGGQSLGFGSLQKEQLKDIADSVQEQLDGGGNIFSVPGEGKFQQLSLSPKDIELLGSKQLNVLEICRFFGVHPDKAFAMASANYKSSEMGQLDYITDSLQPWMRQREMEANYKLLGERHYPQYKIEFDIDGLLLTDLSTRADYMTKTLAAGVMTINAWRRQIGQPTFEGGDTPLVSANLCPINSAKLWGADPANNNDQ